MKKLLMASCGLAILLTATVGLATFFPPSDQPGKPGDGMSRFPAVFMDPSGATFLIWQDERNGRLLDLYFSSSRDGGKTWQKTDTFLESSTKPLTTYAGYQDLVFDGKGQLFVVYRTIHKNRVMDILFNASKDHGATWLRAPVRLNQTKTAFVPRIGLDAKGRLYVTWFEEIKARETYKILFSASDDLGQSWRPTPVVLSDDKKPGAAWFPQLGHDDAGHVYVAWRDKHDLNPSAVFFSASADAGKTWPAQPRQLSDGPKSADNPRLVTGPGGHVYVGWTDRRNGDGDDIYFTRSTDFGQTWVPALRLDTDTPGAAVSARLQLATGPAGHVYAVWEDYRHNTPDTPTASDIYFSRSTNAGETWLPADVRLTPFPPRTTAFARNPRLVADAHGRVVVAWQDARTGTERVYLTYSLDGGRSWLPESVRLDAPLGPDQLGRNASLATDGQGAVAIAWEARPVEKKPDLPPLPIPPTGGFPPTDVTVKVIKLPPPAGS